MPRPGPRPYECVRRAWHSERHQPMRGLIIHQIFRLVHENHSAATKKNKEWQEKLPIVVLKAEEIMYSKANSEAEYSNNETLWDRVNDAVDTIIRKDESSETGEFLPPVLKVHICPCFYISYMDQTIGFRAALNLGCVPVRASRSQRHNNPRTYLRPSYQECSDMSPKFLNENANARNCDLMPAQAPHSTMMKMPGDVDSSHLVLECNKRITPNTSNQHIASAFEKIEVDRYASLNRCSVYTLYYGTSLGPEVPQMGFHKPQKSNSVIVGVPIFSSMSEPVEGGRLQNLFPHNKDKNVAEDTSEAAVKDKKGKGTEIGFDLSLRLGPFSNSGSSREKGSGCVTDNVCYRASHSEVLSKEKEFSFFPMESADNRFWLHQSKWNEESESRNSELVSRKRKQPFSGDVENDRFFWSQDSSSNHFSGQMRRPGL